MDESEETFVLRNYSEHRFSKTESRLARGWLLFLCSTFFAGASAAPGSATFVDLKVPKPGDHSLKILTPTVLELSLVNTKQPDPARVESWDWAGGDGVFVSPDTSGVRVLVGGQTNTPLAVGFKRRPVHAPLAYWDLRIGNHLYFRLGTPIAEGQQVLVVNNGTLWPTNMQFSAAADPLRVSPAIHVNQEGYLPAYSKRAMVGYYLGSLGEMAIPSGDFSIVNTATGATVHQGSLTPRQDVGYLYSPTPYQTVYEADFSPVTTVGEYRLVVPGLGASMPFRIDPGIAMAFARTYALGVFHQRSGYDVRMPFTRFTHAADHLAPASIPTNSTAPFEFTWNTISSYASYTNLDNPPQVAPRMKTPGDMLYPFVRQGTVDVSGGHFEAANYSKVAWNSAQIIHVLLFVVDSLPGVASLDNLGLPESGDGISDVLQEAKWEADCLLKMQDLDGGFYYMIHPLNREYEGDVLPENGDPQVAWPKNTGSTAAAVAALTQCASSPVFTNAYPIAAANYWQKAMLGWRFLTNAIAVHGFAGSYQRIMHFDDAFTHNDDLAWAACELFIATGDSQFRNRLESWFPDPTSPDTMRWGWWGMYACYGNAIRSYAGAVKSGRLQTGAVNQVYLQKCLAAMTNFANENLRWSKENAYGTSFPDPTKRARSAGWYYSMEQAFDMAVAQEFSTGTGYLDAILLNMNYEAGCNPVNVSYVTGLGWKRQHDVVDQYSANDRRLLPKTGVPIGNIQFGFGWAWLYKGELDALCSPSDGATSSPYPFYDRWADWWNVSTEASTPNTVRCLATSVWLAGRTGGSNQPWKSTNATIILPNGSATAGQALTASLEVAETNLIGAKIIWETRGQEPCCGGLSYAFTPLQTGDHWIEAEVQWPDGRRAFATNTIIVTANTNAVPKLSEPLRAGGEFSFLLSGIPQQTFVIYASSNLLSWVPLKTNMLPEAGVLRVTDSQATGYTRRYYRAVTAP